ncbi:MAG TPA: excinuclease ABC subunit C [Acholeplasmataceae bacterium]|nr:excinuclease ABC subunit C [Acholeplasmataceae bacterium]
MPILPGCYIMKDSNEQIIYVGKAKNLKARVKSYFTGAHNLKTTKLVSEIKDLEYVVTNSEQESLILEINLIKEHRPKYNIVFMDDKTYPYIEITNTMPPEIKVVRTKQVKGRLFGPYPNVKSARDTARLLQLLFPMGRIEPIPNFYEEIGFKIIEANNAFNYNEQVKIITKFLKGDIKEVVNYLSEAMQHYSNILMFERAASLRDNIEHIKTTTEKQIISLNDYKDRDIIGIAYDGEDIALQILFMRSGSIIDQFQKVFSYVGKPDEFILSYLSQYYENHLPDELLFDNTFNENELKAIFGSIAIIPKIGDKYKVANLAHKNAIIDLEKHIMLYRDKQQEVIKALDELKELLNLKSNHLIEVFDNSQLFGTAPISAMVVFKNGRFEKKLYRKYHVKNSKQDDYEAMREVIYRRYQRVLKEGLNKPSLILVDGGKGQLNAAQDVLDSLYLDVKVAGLKKNNKHQLESLIYEGNEIKLKDFKGIYRLLAQLSDEVHRYAISFHRQTRKKEASKSILDKVKGLGPKRQRSLLKKYNSIEAIKLASEEELKELGIPKNVILNLKEVLS